MITALPFDTIHAVSIPLVECREAFLQCAPLVETRIPQLFAEMESRLGIAGISNQRVRFEQADIISLANNIFHAPDKTNLWCFSEVDGKIIRVIDGFVPPSELMSCKSENEVLASMVARKVSVNR